MANNTQSAQNVPSTADKARLAGSTSTTGTAPGTTTTPSPATPATAAALAATDTSSAVIREANPQIEPTVPQPPAPSEDFDPAHGGVVDTYPSEAAAANAPGTHVDLTQVNKPVTVVGHQGPPFNRVDGLPAGTHRSVGDALSDAVHTASGGTVGSTGSIGASFDAMADGDDDHAFVANLNEHVASGEMMPADADRALAERYKSADLLKRASLRQALVEHQTTAERMGQNLTQFDSLDTQ
jgi:hypothetical protein